MVNSVNPQQLYKLQGGVKLPHHKNDSLKNGLSRLPIAPKVYLSLRINRGNVAKSLVAIGDKVLKGQIIAKPDTTKGSFIHASTSGRVSAIIQRATASPEADISTVIEITSDGKEQWVEWEHRQINQNYIDSVTREHIVDCIRDGGLVGLGGAGFPTYLKYNLNNDIDTLIVNGAECEPYITCDEQLMLDFPDDLINGILLMMKASGASQAIFALEDQVGNIKSNIDKRVKERALENIIVIKVPTIYPAGGEKQLIKVLTGKEVPSGGLPLDLGIIVQNVGTIKALSDFISQGRPLVERIVTVAGDCIGMAQNFITAIGTPMSHLLQQAQFDKDKTYRLIVGGPMMGYSMPNCSIGIDKTTNCLLALSKKSTQHYSDTLPCIRCGECVNVCPAYLLPQQLHWYIKGENLEKAREHHVFDCIECGACAWVCPSQIKLVDYYRYAKSELKYLDFKREKSDKAQIRHEQREARLEHLKAQRAAKRKRTRKRTTNPEKIQQDLSATMLRIQKAKAEKVAQQKQAQESDNNAE